MPKMPGSEAQAPLAVYSAQLAAPSAQPEAVSQKVINETLLPFSPDHIPVFGDDPGANQCAIGAEKDLVGYRRQNFAIKLTQAGGVATAPLVFAGLSTPINILSYGGPVGNQVGGAMTLGGYPASMGTFTYERSNLYPGGLMCQPELQFVIVAFAMRPKQLFRFTGGVIVREHSWMDAYQAELQQLLLDNMTWTYQKNRQTFQILGETGAQYPSALSSGAPLASSQNGEPLRGNIVPSAVGLPVAAESGSSIGATPDSQINVTCRPFTLLNDAQAIQSSGLTADDPLIVELEVLMFGYCRPLQR